MRVSEWHVAAARTSAPSLGKSVIRRIDCTAWPRTEIPPAISERSACFAKKTTRTFLTLHGNRLQKVETIFRQRACLVENDQVDTAACVDCGW